MREERETASADSVDIKAWYRRKIADVENNLACLDPAGPIRSILTGDKMAEYRCRPETENDQDLVRWPPLLSFIAKYDLRDILAFEQDFNHVLEKSKAEEQNHLVKALKNLRDCREYQSLVFETFAKSQMLKQFSNHSVALDHLLPNGRNVDIRVEIAGRMYYLEVTVLTQSDEDKGIWEEFFKAQKANPQIHTLVRPGKYDPPNPKGNSTWYHACRFCAKVYDKLADKWDPVQSQLSPDSPNILLICTWPSVPCAGEAEKDGFRLALDDLFAYELRKPASSENRIASGSDFSLRSWLAFAATDTGSRNSHRLSDNEYTLRSAGLRAARRKISAVMLFESCKLQESRVNYNSDEPYRLSHEEMAKFDKILGTPPVWCPD